MRTLLLQVTEYTALMLQTSYTPGGGESVARASVRKAGVSSYFEAELHSRTPAHPRRQPDYSYRNISEREKQTSTAMGPHLALRHFLFVVDYSRLVTGALAGVQSCRKRWQRNGE